MDISLIQIVTLIAQIGSIWLAHYLGTRKSEKEYINKVQLHRYKKFYVPYISALYRGYTWETGFKNHSCKVRGFILDLLTKHLELLDPKTLALYPGFYNAFLNMLEYEEGNEDYTDAPEEFEKAFNEISETILLEAQRLAAELGLPPLAANLLKLYHPA